MLVVDFSALVSALPLSAFIVGVATVALLILIPVISARVYHQLFDFIRKVFSS